MRKTPKTHIEQKKWFCTYGIIPLTTLSQNSSIIEILTRLRLSVCSSIISSEIQSSRRRRRRRRRSQKNKKTSSDFSSIIFGRAQEHACIVALRSIRKKSLERILKNKTLTERFCFFSFFFFLLGGPPMNKILEWSLCSIKPR